MADQFVAATVGFLLDKAVSVAANRINLVLGFRKDLEAMQEHAKDIQAVLADAEAKQSRNPIVRRWLRKVEAAAVEADNVLDELLYESLRRKVESMNKVMRAEKVCLFFSISKHDISFRWRMGSKVREINEMFKNFILEVSGIGLIRMEDAMAMPRAKDEVVIDRETNSLPLPFVAGRDKEVSKTVDMLLSNTSASVSVLSIVGMGGLGKTTLAKSVYNNSQIDSHFGQKIWVCVSNKFEVTELFRLMLESLTGGRVEKSSQDGIVRKIGDQLVGKRFLLVLDDVWNEEQKLWDEFFVSLIGLNTESGSCCLVTTRLQKTADLVSTFDPFVLDKLADDECWYILCRRAAKDGQMPDQINVHKEEILKRCQGLPLAANAVGGLLSLQKREDWLSIVKDTILMVGEYVEGEIYPILRLSFDYLPSLSIKKCFAYCSIYSKDSIMRGGRLVELWMAEGFLQDMVERRTTMEEVGDYYVKVLLQSSLLEKTSIPYGEDGYQMHDLVHDLAEYVSKREQNDGDQYSDLQIRHLAFPSEYMDLTYKYNERSNMVRIVKGRDTSDEMLLRFKRMRVLNLCCENLEGFPNAIAKLKHLRYLDVSYSRIITWPKSICMLYNLQTLRLHYNLSLPYGLSNLISLRHLHFHLSDCKVKMPPNMGQLTCLQTLTVFNVGEEKGCQIKELGSMKNLKGVIEIRNLEVVKGKEGARLANLLEKQKLVGLELCWDSTSLRGNENDERVLEGLEPHPKLQELRLRNYMGARLPQWFGKLTSLSKLRFNNCKNCKELPKLGNLPYLEVLEVEGSEHVQCLGDSLYFESSRGGKDFPPLKILKLKNLPNLSEWKEFEAENGHGVYSKLESLHICDCCQLASSPKSFPSLKTLKIKGNMRVSVVRDIMGESASLLKKLVIKSVGGLDSLADVVENHLTGLESFKISGCDKLTNIPSSTFEGCTSLDTLKVFECPNLASCALNFQQTPSLSVLWLYGCPNMFTTNAMPRGFSYLTNLFELSIGPFTDDSVQLFDWSGLIACSPTICFLRWYGYCLPHQLRHFTGLELLHLASLTSVETLPDWLGNFTSLLFLELFDCPKLQHLPSPLGRLPNLREVEISNCPLLPESSIQNISSTLPNLKISRK